MGKPAPTNTYIHTYILSAIKTHYAEMVTWQFLGNVMLKCHLSFHLICTHIYNIFIIKTSCHRVGLAKAC
jgi:hypothetical protein